MHIVALNHAWVNLDAISNAFWYGKVLRVCWNHPSSESENSMTLGYTDYEDEDATTIADALNAIDAIHAKGREDMLKLTD